jgi:hypothetical protein
VRLRTVQHLPMERWTSRPRAASTITPGFEN